MFALANKIIMPSITSPALTLSKLITSTAFIEYKNLVIAMPSLATSNYVIINTIFTI